MTPITRNGALSILQRHERELHARGVRHAAIFGSAARGEATPQSDLDILIELDPEARLDVFAYAGLKSYIAGLFEGEVDVVSRGNLKPHLRSTPEHEIVHAF
jgi:predicted nucleotidyltransferase